MLDNGGDAGAVVCVAEWVKDGGCVVCGGGGWVVKVLYNYTAVLSQPLLHTDTHKHYIIQNTTTITSINLYNVYKNYPLKNT